MNDYCVDFSHNTAKLPMPLPIHPVKTPPYNYGTDFFHSLLPDAVTMHVSLNTRAVLQKNGAALTAARFLCGV